MVMRRVRGVVREIRGMVHFNFRRVRCVVMGRVEVWSWGDAMHGPFQL